MVIFSPVTRCIKKNKKMKRVTNKELMSVILINVGALVFFSMAGCYTTIDKK